MTRETSGLGAEGSPVPPSFFKHLYVEERIDKPAQSKIPDDAVVWYWRDGGLRAMQHDGSEVTIWDGSGGGSGGSSALEDSGNDNADGGDNYHLPNAEDAIDLQGKGDVRNASFISVDDRQVNNLFTTAYLSSNQNSWPSGSDTQVNIDTTDSGEDNFSAFDSTNNKIVVQKAGVYMVTGAVRNEQNTTSPGRILGKVTKNGSALTLAQGRIPGNDSIQDKVTVVIPPTTVSLSANDDLKLVGYQNSGSDLGFQGGKSNNYLSMIRLG